jgi:hypothetical protein
MCDAIDDAGDPACRLAPITVAAAHVLVDACESASLGDGERVELDGEHLAKVAEGPNGSPRVRETNSTKNGTPSASRSLVGAAKPIGLASSTNAEIIREELRTPRAAAVAGVVFSLLFGASLVLIRVSVPGNPTDARNWLTNSGRRHAVLLAVNLVPFAGIAFLPAPRAAPIVVGRR